MVKTVELEIDDIHELMFQAIMQDRQDAPSLEDWAQDTLQAILYQAYQNRGEGQRDAGTDVEEAQQ